MAKKKQWAVGDVREVPDEEIRRLWRAYRVEAYLLQSSGQFPERYERGTTGTLKEYALLTWAADQLTGEHDCGWTEQWSAAYERFKQVSLEEQT